MKTPRIWLLLWIETFHTLIMTSLNDIQKPVEKDYLLYERKLTEILHCEIDHIALMIDYILSNRGKGIRPLLTLLAASHSNRGGTLEPRSHIAAAMIEMVHTASLVHDDIVDESYIRRGQQSVFALWRSKAAVIIGDYMLSRCLSAGMRSGYHDMAGYIMEAVSQLCEGELIQGRHSETLDMTRDIYMDIIRKKTASLMGISSGVGAMSVHAPAGETERMRLFGENLGMAFQIRDDILDFAPSSQTGKEQCNDLKERKITLPLLAVLEQAGAGERHSLLTRLAEIRQVPSNAEYLRLAVEEGGGLEAAAVAMNEYIERARAVIGGCVTSPASGSLQMLCDYIAGR